MSTHMFLFPAYICSASFFPLSPGVVYCHRLRMMLMDSCTIFCGRKWLWIQTLHSIWRLTMAIDRHRARSNAWWTMSVDWQYRQFIALHTTWTIENKSTNNLRCIVIGGRLKTCPPIFLASVFFCFGLTSWHIVFQSDSLLLLGLPVFFVNWADFQKNMINGFGHIWRKNKQERQPIPFLCHKNRVVKPKLPKSVFPDFVFIIVISSLFVGDSNARHIVWSTTNWTIVSSCLQEYSHQVRAKSIGPGGIGPLWPR